MTLGFIKHYRHVFHIVFFACYFILGVFIFRDYGLSWDEPTSRDNGIVAYQYITKQNSDLLTYRDRDYGTAFELPLVVIEKAIGLTTSQQIYYLRHFLTFSLFFISAVFFYNIASQRFSRGLALLGLAFLILSPRIFADSFYNSKDIALLSMMIIAVFTLISFLKKPSLRHAALHAIASALVVDIRLPGLIIFPITVGFFLADTFILSRPLWKARISMLVVYFLLFLGFVVLFWPYLWSNPIGNFMNAFLSFSHFTRLSDTVFYLSNYIPDAYVPWHYPLVWIGVSTPLSYLVLFVSGVGFTLGKSFRGIFRFYKDYHMDLLFSVWFFGPLLMVTGLNSALYDGWRQLYFIYPAFIFLTLVGVEGLLFYIKNRYPLRVFLMLLGVVNLLSVVRFMTINHPYQNLYFNELLGSLENAKQKFDLDYWGLTFREGLEYITSHDSSETIPVFFAYGHKSNIDMLREVDKQRFVVTNRAQDAKYILNNYRWYKDRTNYRWDPYIYESFHPTLYNVTVDGVAVMTVLKPSRDTYAVQ